MIIPHYNTFNLIFPDLYIQMMLADFMNGVKQKRILLCSYMLFGVCLRTVREN